MVQRAFKSTRYFAPKSASPDVRIALTWLEMRFVALLPSDDTPNIALNPEHKCGACGKLVHRICGAEEKELIDRNNNEDLQREISIDFKIVTALCLHSNFKIVSALLF
jgi:hypothetical protein